MGEGGSVVLFCVVCSSLLSNGNSSLMSGRYFGKKCLVQSGFVSSADTSTVVLKHRQVLPLVGVLVRSYVLFSFEPGVLYCRTLVSGLVANVDGQNSGLIPSVCMRCVLGARVRSFVGVHSTFSVSCSCLQSRVEERRAKSPPRTGWWRPVYHCVVLFSDSKSKDFYCVRTVFLFSFFFVVECCRTM